MRLKTVLPGNPRLALSLALGSAQGLSFAALHASQEEIPVIQAEYRGEQAEQGRDLYARACAACHLEDLQGSFEASELAGPNFLAAWGEQPLARVVGYVMETMPPGGAGSLSSDEYGAVIAYILSENDVPSGQAALDAAAVLTSADAGTTALTRTPIPGRPGTGPSPVAVDREPEVIGNLTWTMTS